MESVATGKKIIESLSVVEWPLLAAKRTFGKTLTWPKPKGGKLIRN
jgi:hypothetical protein